MKAHFARPLRGLQRNILAGIITIGPLFVTYLIFSFLSARWPRPACRWCSCLRRFSLGVAQPAMAAIGAGHSADAGGALCGGPGHIAGDRPPGLRPLRGGAGAAAVCGQGLHVGAPVAGHHDGQERDPASAWCWWTFPSPGQKSIGFLTRTLTDSTTGELLAAVLLPNAINPTSAFLQILPMDRVTETDLTMEQAMSMMMTGGAVGPETIRYSQAGSVEAREHLSRRCALA